MCGIAGYIDFQSGSVSRGILQAMARSLRHRGPDDSGVLISGPCGLAHTRLSIIDVGGSPQPMSPSGSELSITYNGELYNYRELRAQLEARGVRCQTAGDTEVLLRHVELDGVEALPRFDGMFAFAAWHARQQWLLLARDPIGKKPLFFANPEPGVFVFGSEIKAVLQHPMVEVSLNTASMRQALRFRAVYGEQSLYEGIRQVQPGHWLLVDRDGQRSGRFYDLPAEAARYREEIDGLAEDELVARGHALLEDAVRKRLVADVEVGAFLSGGLDSSVIVALMQRARRAAGDASAVRTFSVGFEGDENGETHHARLVAQTLGTGHTEVHIDEARYAALLGPMSMVRDAPVSEPADPAIARMSEVARRDVKVVLSGEGADEAFAGYPKYAFARTPRGVRTIIRAVGPSRTARIAGLLGLSQRRALVAARSLAQNDELGRVVQWFSYLDRNNLQQLLPGLDWSEDEWGQTTGVHRSVLQSLPPSSGAMERMQTLDCLTWLPSNLLERGDRMTMAYGLELRVPFLDKQMLPFGLALRDRMKVRGRTSKWILRQWANGLVPDSIRQRRKWGFRVPLAAWFRGGLRAMANDYLTSGRGLCGMYADASRVRRLLVAHERGEADLSLELFTLLTAEIWFSDVFAASQRGAGADSAAAMVH